MRSLVRLPLLKEALPHRDRYTGDWMPLVREAILPSGSARGRSLVIYSASRTKGTAVAPESIGIEQGQHE